MTAWRNLRRLREAGARARELRQRQTPAEDLLWNYLRGRRLCRWKFRRQFPLEGYVLDFYCHELKLVVELDGGIHSEDRQMAHDENRDSYLRSLGCTILRIPNDALLNDLHATLLGIAKTAAELAGGDS